MVSLSNSNNTQQQGMSQISLPSSDEMATSRPQSVISTSTLEQTHHQKDVTLEGVRYVPDDAEELGAAGAQTEHIQEKNSSFLWAVIKQIKPGMDLSKVVLPTFILEPRSFLDKLSDYYYHSDLLCEAVGIDDPVNRMISIVKWYLSGFYKKPKGAKKPYNPILGECFRCYWENPANNSRTFFIAEQVSHHPPISAFHVSNRKDGYYITSSLLTKSKYNGTSVSAILEGRASLHLIKRDETYTITMPHANCKGIIIGPLCLELGGKVEIVCADTGCRCELEFKLKPMLSSSDSINIIVGKIFLNNNVTHTIEGHWDRAISINDKRTGSGRSTILWEVNDQVRQSRLSRFVVDLNQQRINESQRLWQHVTEALKENDQRKATREKTKLEDAQRMEAKQRGSNPWIVQNFALDTFTNEWRYKWVDSRPWSETNDLLQFERNFQIRTLVRNRLSSSSSNLRFLDVTQQEYEIYVEQQQRRNNRLTHGVLTSSTPRANFDSNNNQNQKDANSTNIGLVFQGQNLTNYSDCDSLDVIVTESLRSLDTNIQSPSDSFFIGNNSMSKPLINNGQFANQLHNHHGNTTMVVDEYLEGQINQSRFANNDNNTGPNSNNQVALRMREMDRHLKNISDRVNQSYDLLHALARRQKQVEERLMSPSACMLSHDKNSSLDKRLLIYVFITAIISFAIATLVVPR